MAARISFDIVTSKGDVVESYKDTACFGGVWSRKFGDWGFKYFPTLTDIQPSEGAEFLRDMKEIGFQISDPDRVILDQTYYIPTYESNLGQPVARAWVFGNLTLVRYLDEFSKVIWEYLALKRVMPDADKFHLLQLAHFTRLNGGKGDYYGQGHALIDISFGEYPERYASWQDVKERFQSGFKGVQEMFSGRSGMGAYLNVRELLRKPDGVKQLHASAVGEPPKDIHHQPTVVSGAVQGYVPDHDQAA